MYLRRAIARAYWSVSRWDLAGNRADPDRPAILIGAPHTSNWDFVFMLTLCWNYGIAPRWLGKHTLFRGPAGAVMRRLGGVPVDRTNPAGIVTRVLEEVASGRMRILVITPEGTRGKTAYWKSGFYRIAREAGLPVTLGFADSATMTVGFGPTLEMTGDVGADMDLIRAFYADKAGVRPELKGEPRLRDEDGPAA